MENFQSEIKKKLLDEYKYKIELHAHTSPVSSCSQITPAEMIETYNKLGYDGIVVTNHFLSSLSNGRSKEQAIEYYMKDYYDTKKEGEKCNLKVYLGAEVRFDECFNDYLVYGVDEEYLKVIYDYFPKGIEAFTKDAKKENSVLIQAHPFRNGMELVNPDFLDGVECFNMHPGHNSRIGLATRYAKENEINIIISGTDYHHPGRRHEGLSAIRTKYLPEDSYGIAEILKSGDYILEIAGQSIILP